jgi:hypothetical protein
MLDEIDHSIEGLRKHVKDVKPTETRNELYLHIEALECHIEHFQHFMLDLTVGLREDIEKTRYNHFAPTGAYPACDVPPRFKPSFD